MRSRKVIIIILICCALLSSVAAVAAISNSVLISREANLILDVTPAPHSDAVKSESQPPDVTKTPTPTESPVPTESPTTVPTEITTDLDPEKPIVALSFDDGPGSLHTERILDILEENNVTATFFIVGDMAKNHEDMLARHRNLGCEIGNHTMTHKTNFKKSGVDKVIEELKGVDRLVEKATGDETWLVRPPWGAFTDEVLQEVGKPFILWSVDTLDWKSRNKDAVVEVVKRDVFDGCIILMHDIYSSTAEACAEVIPWLLDEGYQVTSVSEMFAARGVELEGGKVYRKAPTAQEYMESKSDN